ncbi:HlyU family transcriptional regulator [uncultured Shimia sp.]|uniref:HlyU family transcriptional regulator n=1 Tax=uncultured Shimia sp. TaxID=573152 RepID=UPI00260E241E|nr:HlyU family transcriptional regulator [uncultured Shimia sp.]
MSFLKKLFGGGGANDAAAEKTAQPVEYKGYKITPCPIPEGGQFRISARIDGVVNGEAKSHTLIRADVIRDQEEAVEASIGKAKQMIDQMGDQIF